MRRPRSFLTVAALLVLMCVRATEVRNLAGEDPASENSAPAEAGKDVTSAGEAAAEATKEEKKEPPKGDEQQKEAKDKAGGEPKEAKKEEKSDAETKESTGSPAPPDTSGAYRESDMSKVTEETDMEDPEQEFTAGQTDDSGADEELRRLRKKAADLEASIAKQQEEMKKLVHKNKAVDEEKDMLEKGKDRKDPGWAEKTEASKESGSEVRKEMDKLILSKDSDNAAKDRAATSGGSDQVATAQERADQVKSAAEKKSQQMKLDGAKARIMAKADAKVLTASAKAEAARIEKEAEQRQLKAQQEASEMKKAEKKDIPEGGGLIKSTDTGAAAKVMAAEVAENEQALQNATVSAEFSKGLGHTVNTKQMKRRQADLLKEKALLDKMKDGPEKDKKLLEWQQKQKDLDALKAKVNSKAAGDAKQKRTEGKLNGDKKEKENVVDEALAKGLDPKVLDLKKASPKAVAKAIAKGLKKAKDDKVRPSSTTTQSRDQKKSDNLTKKTFLKAKPTMPSKTSIAGVQIPQGSPGG